MICKKCLARGVWYFWPEPTRITLIRSPLVSSGVGHFHIHCSCFAAATSIHIARRAGIFLKSPTASETRRCPQRSIPTAIEISPHMNTYVNWPAQRGKNKNFLFTAFSICVKGITTDFTNWTVKRTEVRRKPLPRQTLRRSRCWLLYENLERLLRVTQHFGHPADSFRSPRGTTTKRGFVLCRSDVEISRNLRTILRTTSAPGREIIRVPKHSAPPVLSSPIKFVLDVNQNGWVLEHK